MYREGPTRRRARSATTGSPLESLEARTYFAVHAFFTAGRLSVFGDAAANSIVIARNGAGTILVNGGSVGIRGGTPAGTAARQILVYGLSGDDEIRLDETHGPLPKATLDGGPGNDTVTGGSGADILVGRAGNDFLFGQGGADLLTGGDGNDALIGGADNDMAFGQAGNDNLFWAPGDGSDRNEGGDGLDTVVVNGATVSEHFTAAPDGQRVRFERTDPTPFSLDIGTAENLSLRANAGDDSFVAATGLGSLIHLTVDGGAGDDTILGSDGGDELAGRDGNDLLVGGGGNDLMAGGAGDDTFVWDPGDGSDTAEGQDGNDAMIFNGSDLAERIGLSANGSRVSLARDPGTVAMDLNGLERVDLNTLAGADVVFVGDLTGTSLTAVNVNFQAAAGGGDGAADSVVVDGTGQADTIETRGFGTGFSVTGLHALVTVTGSEGTRDGLTINALGGNDNVNASTMVAGIVKLTEDGGDGDDEVIGSRGDDMLFGGGGDDDILGFRGSDAAFLGDGDDTFEWLPGDGSDTVEGQAGRDTLLFNGSNDPEEFVFATNGNRVRFSRNLGNVTMDLSGVEATDLNAFGGADKVTVNDMSATDLTGVNVSLASALGETLGDAASDTVIVNGTNGSDGVQVAAFKSNSFIAVGGILPLVTISGSDGVDDHLTVNTLAGNDTVDAASLPAGLIDLTIVGGAGNDALVGGAGDDTFVWNPGDGSDSVDGLGGRDAMIFNGSDLAEIFGISANGNRVRLSRDLGNVNMDVNDVERVGLNALGGADKVVVNDLTGTDVEEIDLDLAAGDGQVDSVVVNGSGKSELIPVTGTAGGILVNGGFAEAASLQYFMVIRAVEPADMLQVNGNEGSDSIDASGLQTPVTFRAEGGAGDDIIRGSPGDDVLVGGDGDDGVDGNGGSDSAFLGAGNDLFIWDPGDGSDLVEGMAGADSLIFRGSNSGETIQLSANGSRLRVARDPGTVAMDVDDVERVDVIAQGGPDNVFVNDLAGTDVVAVNINLGAGGTANGDLLADAVAVRGSAGGDGIVVTEVAGVSEVVRPTTLVRITGADPDFDALTVDGLAGNDTIDSTGLTPGIIQLGIVGGEGDDNLIGSPGDDVLDGGFGNDTLIGGAGDDVLLGGPGVDVLDGGSGNNVLVQG